MTEATEVRESITDYARRRAELARTGTELPAPAECRRVREAARVSQRQVADELGVSNMTVSDWERGKFAPTLENAIAYRRLLEELADAAGTRIRWAG